MQRLASFSRLILFDKRGTGLSDRVPLTELPTLEQRMEDVHGVMDAVGSKRAALVGVSEGGPMGSLFAATYPERSVALIMIGSHAKRTRDDDYPWGDSAEDREKFFDLMQRDWGKPVGIEERAPSLAGTKHSGSGGRPTCEWERARGRCSRKPECVRSTASTANGGCSSLGEANHEQIHSRVVQPLLIRSEHAK